MGFRISLCSLLLATWIIAVNAAIQQLKTEDINNLASKFQGTVNNLFGPPGVVGLKGQIVEDHHPSADQNANVLPQYNVPSKVDIDSPEAFRAKFSQAKSKAIEGAKGAILSELIAEDIITNFKVPLDDIPKILEAQDLTGSALAKDCSDSDDNKEPKWNEVIHCLENKYRTIDGSCNNPLHRNWGKAFSKFLRMIKQASYSDGISAPRNKSINGNKLPSARKISSTVLLNSEGQKHDHFAWSHFFALFGQFLDHDLTNTPQFTDGENSLPPKCCNVPLPHRECFPIDTTGDAVYESVNQKCMEFVRSLPAEDSNCKLGIREQLNQVTSFIDASQIYGSTEQDANKLKDPLTGKLKVTKSKDGDLLPNKGDLSANECQKPNFHGQCDFSAGDNRVNMVPSLTTIHTVFLRQHNRLIDLLQKNGWNDPEELYQEARRIVGAQLQRITYKEFFDIVFRVSRQKFPEVNLENPISYDPEINPTIDNEFATAAFRFGHSMINNMFSLASLDFKILSPNPNKVSEHYFSPKELYKPHKIDEYLRGHSVDHSQDTDNILTDQLTNFLFKKPGSSKPALDLASLNIQRGRDHGLPSYTAYRKLCKLTVPKTFQALKPIMLPDCNELLPQVYENVEDIDLWVGGLCENTSQVGAVGPTFGCILHKQFTNLRKGDRFFYNHKFPKSFGFLAPFTEEQVEEIDKTTLATILCLNANFNEITEEAMLVTGPKISCKEIIKNDLDISKFAKSHTSKLKPSFPKDLNEFNAAFQPLTSSSLSADDDILEKKDDEKFTQQSTE